MKFQFIVKHRGIWPVAWMCGALGVSRSGFHAWLVRPGRLQGAGGGDDAVASVLGCSGAPPF